MNNVCILQQKYFFSDQMSCDIIFSVKRIDENYFVGGQCLDKLERGLTFDEKCVFQQKNFFSDQTSHDITGFHLIINVQFNFYNSFGIPESRQKFGDETRQKRLIKNSKPKNYK